VHPPRRRIAEALSRQPCGLGVAEIAARVGLGCSAVREHLRKLSDTGVVSIERDEPRGRGRPRFRYRLADGGAPWVAAHQELVRLLVESIVRSGADTTEVEAFGRRQGAFFATGADAAGIVEALTRLGFAPGKAGSSADAGRGRLTLRLGHCPFHDAVVAPGGDIVCRLHRGLADGIAAAVAPGSRLTAFEPESPARPGCRLVVDGLGTGEPRDANADR
jgi:predicted ArsR family transcriptional regulator